MIVDVPAGRTATLAFDATTASKVRVFSPSGAVALDQGRLSTPIAGGSPQTFWIEAFAPSTSMADIAFTLTVTGTGVQDSITMTSIEVLVDRINFKGDGNIDIRIDKTTNIGNGGLPGYAANEDVEWIRNTREKKNEDETAWDTNQSAPAAFVRNKVLTAEVHFTVAPAVAVEALKIKADSTQPYGGFESTTVTYAALPSGGGEYKATFTTPAASTVNEIDINTKLFSWKVESITVAGKTYNRAIDLRNTQHRLYTVLDTPVAPMAEPWATVLELAAGLADGQKNGAAVVTELTKGTHHSTWQTFANKPKFIKAAATLVYDPTRAGRTTGWAAQTYDLVSFMGDMPNATNTQQCNDNANVVCIFARSLGVAANGYEFDAFGPFPGEDPAGKFLVPCTYQPAGNGPVERNERFSFHQIVQFDGKVYDPSTRPVGEANPIMGMAIDEYLNLAFPGQVAADYDDNEVTDIGVR